MYMHDCQFSVPAVWYDTFVLQIPVEMVKVVKTFLKKRSKFRLVGNGQHNNFFGLILTSNLIL